MSTTIAQLLERVERLDARIKQAPGQLAFDLSSKGTGKPCGDGWISQAKTCRKGAGAAPKAAAQAQAQALTVSTDAVGNVLINGKPPVKALGGGAFGDTFLADSPDGPVVVKVDRLKNADPMERDPGVPLDQQRRNMVERERSNMEQAHQLGIGPQPVGPVQQLPDGRLAFAYRMVEGVKLADDHRAMRMTDEAAAVLAQPQALANYAAGVARLARAMADAGFDHGDVHGGNIVLSPDGSPNLIDWGYADRRPNASAADRATIEAQNLSVLGGNLLSVNAMVGRNRELYQPGKQIKPGIKAFLSDTVSLAWKAQRAYVKVIDDYDDQWLADERNDPPNPGQAIRDANRLVRELGIPFDQAERRVGLRPPIPPQIEREAVKAREKVFGEDRLRRFRRTVDQHYAAWQEHSYE